MDLLVLPPTTVVMSGGRRGAVSASPHRTYQTTRGAAAVVSITQNAIGDNDFR
jgi:hypothetical protein